MERLPIYQPLINGEHKMTETPKTLEDLFKSFNEENIKSITLSEFFEKLNEENDKIYDAIKDENDRLKAVLLRIAKQSPDHFASALAQAALDGWDARK